MQFTDLLAAGGFDTASIVEILRLLFFISLTDAGYACLRPYGVPDYLNVSFSMGTFYDTLAHYLGVENWGPTLRTLVDEDPDILSDLCISLYDALLRSIIDRLHRFQEKAVFSTPLTPQVKVPERGELPTLQKEWSVCILYGLDEPFRELLPWTRLTNGTLDDLARRCTQDTLFRHYCRDLFRSLREHEHLVGESFHGADDVLRISLDMSQIHEGEQRLFSALDRQHEELCKAQAYWRTSARAKTSTRGKDKFSPSARTTPTHSLPPRSRIEAMVESGLQFLSKLRRQEDTASLEPTTHSQRPFISHISETDGSFVAHHLGATAHYTVHRFIRDNDTLMPPPEALEWIQASRLAFVVEAIASQVRLCHTEPAGSIATPPRSRRLCNALNDINALLTNFVSRRRYILCLTLTDKPDQRPLSPTKAKMSSPDLLPYHESVCSVASPTASEAFVSSLAYQVLHFRILELHHSGLFGLVPFTYSHFVHHFGVLMILRAQPITAATRRRTQLVLHDPDPRRATHRMMEILGLSFAPHQYLRDVILLDRACTLQLEIYRHQVLSRYLPAIRCLQKNAPTFTPRIRRWRFRHYITQLQSYLRRIAEVQPYRVRQLNAPTDLLFGASLVLALMVRAEKVPSELLEALKRSERQRNDEVQAYRTVAAIQIQAWWRGSRARRIAEEKRTTKLHQHASFNIQNVCRRFLAQATVFNLFESEQLRHKSALLIQTNVRRWLHRKAFLRLVKLRVAIVPIKRIASRRVVLKHRIHMLSLLSQTHTQRDMIRRDRELQYWAKVIQALWRGHFVRSQYKVLQSAAHICQVHGLTHLHHQRFLLIRERIIVLQRWWVAVLQLRNLGEFFATPHYPWPRPFVGKHALHQHSVLKKHREIYLRRELKAFGWLRFPLLLYQAVFYKSKQLAVFQHSFLVQLRLYVSQYSPDVYPETWAWSLSHILQHCAYQSWSIQRNTIWALRGASWDVYEARCASLLSDTPTSCKKDVGKLGPPPSLRDVPVPLQLAALAALTQIPPLLYLQAVRLGGQHTLILVSEPSAQVSPELGVDCRSAKKHVTLHFVNRVYAWGWNDRGQLGHSRPPGRQRRRASAKVTLPSTTISPVEFLDVSWERTQHDTTGRLSYEITRSVDRSSHIASIGTGDDFCVALTQDGLVFTWGDNAYGQCGHGPRYRVVQEPRVIESLRDVSITSCSTGPRHVLALSAGHDPYIWGAYGHVGLETLPPQCNIYYPIRLPVDRWLKKHESCVSVHCGTGFNVLRTTDNYTLLIWGRNDCGQLGCGQDKPPSSLASPVSVSMVDLCQSPSLYLRIASVSCGSNFVVACVQPSRSRIFLWGAFCVFDAPKDDIGQRSTATRSTAISPFLSQLGARSPAVQKPVLNEATFAVRSIREPTVVTHPLWSDSAVVQAVCGHTSSVTVVLDCNEVYGFSFLQPQWFRKDPPHPLFDGPEVQLRNKTQSEPPSLSELLLRSPHRTAVQQKDTAQPSRRLGPLTLRGSFHLRPALYQFKTFRHGIFNAQRLETTYNSRGLQLDYVTSTLLVPPRTRKSLRDHVQKKTPIVTTWHTALTASTAAATAASASGALKSSTAVTSKPSAALVPQISTSRKARTAYLTRSPQKTDVKAPPKESTLRSLPSGRGEKEPEPASTQAVAKMVPQRVADQAPDLPPKEVYIAVESPLSGMAASSLVRGVCLAETFLGLHQSYRTYGSAVGQADPEMLRHFQTLT